MFKVSRKAVPALLVLAALILSAWTAVGPSVSAATPVAPVRQPTGLPTQGGGSGATPTLHSWLADQPRVTDVVNRLNAFKINVRIFNRFNVGRNERMYIQDALVGNTLELQMMQFAITRATNTDFKDLLQFMIDQHTKELSDMTQIARRVGVSTTVDLHNASVFPGTPKYDLGVRTEDLIKEYMDPLTSYTGTSFDQAALDLILSFHVDDVQSELAALRFARIGPMQTLIRHGADVTELHIALMDAVEQRDFLGLPGDVSFEPFQGTKSGSGTPVPSVMPTSEGTLVPSVMPTSEGTVAP